MSGWGFTNRPSYTICGASANAVGDSEWGGSSVRKRLRESDYTGEFWVRNKNPLGKKANGDIAITPQEQSILQGYPAGFTLVGSKKMQHLQIANAVPPPVARAILETFDDTGNIG